MSLTFHPIANIFPLMEGVPFEAFVEDIRLNGQHVPILVHDGQIIDGRNRYRACQQLGMPPRIETWDGSGSIEELVLSLNVHHRHLTDSQKACVAVQIEALFAVDARRRQVAALKQYREGNAFNPVRDGGVDRSRDRAARALFVSGRYVQDAKALKKHDPDAFNEVFAGRIALSRARKRFAGRRRVAKHGVAPAQSVSEALLFGARMAEHPTDKEHELILAGARQILRVSILDAVTGKRHKLTVSHLTADAVIELLTRKDANP